jgi:hypothetical protein
MSRLARRVALMVLAVIQLSFCFSVASAAADDLKYQLYMDAVVAANDVQLRALSLSGSDEGYEVLGWVIDGTTAMFEGSRDPSYIIRTLTWVENMKSTATVVDSDGYLNWAGSWKSPYSRTSLFYHQYDLEVGRAMARVARLILTDPRLAKSYGDRAFTVYEFVQKNIADKWLRSRAGSFSYLRNLRYNFGDKAAFWGHMLADLVAVQPNETYSAEIATVVEAFTARLEPFGTNGAMRMRDDGTGDNSDTSHANHTVHFAVRMYLDGLGLSATQVKGLAKLLTSTIWNQSLRNPMFTNYTDGSNGSCGRRGPYGCGQIYQGWVRLALVDDDVRSIMDAVFDAISAGRSNPSLAYNSTLYGKVGLAGNLGHKNAD